MGSCEKRFPHCPMIGLSYTVSGDPHRPAILFLHGFMGSGADWAGTISALDERFYCVAPDLPGHGRSLGLTSQVYTNKGAAKMLRELLDGLEVSRAALAGYSMGGRLALYLALRHPERYPGLFLESASPGIDDAAEREARRRNDPYELARSLRGMGAGNQLSLWGELGGLEAPALAVAGALDEKCVGIARRMAALNPRLRTAVVSGAGHNVRLEAPEAYLGLLHGFLESL
jgi:2-succinyl-6-hydroxy-2,4-cyclohexadiene-1-carboxylate synthase